mmetsp:Transcript_23640/g.39660  ORF Transcript_23640/g.39660 Transcript_23640/m.39660 type:complete len:256 (-) Transcript_23640:340-1107(-)
MPAPMSAPQRGRSRAPPHPQRAGAPFLGPPAFPPPGPPPPFPPGQVLAPPLSLPLRRPLPLPSPPPERWRRATQSWARTPGWERGGESFLSLPLGHLSEPERVQLRLRRFSSVWFLLCALFLWALFPWALFPWGLSLWSLFACLSSWLAFPSLRSFSRSFFRSSFCETGCGYARDYARVCSSCAKSDGAMGNGSAIATATAAGGEESAIGSGSASEKENENAHGGRRIGGFHLRLREAHPHGSPPCRAPSEARSP